MRFWKQLFLGLVLVVGGVCLFAWFVPGAGGILEKAGLGRLAPGAGGTASAQTAPAGERPGGRSNATLVVTAPVGTDRINDRLNAIGSGEAIQSVVVTPQVSGTIAEVLVRSGEKVEKGQLLARIDQAEQTIARDQAQVALRSAEERAQAYGNLQSVARLDVFNAGIAVETARLALQNAELDLKRRDIVAPIDGIAGIVTINPGDYVTTQTAIATLDNRSEILVDYWVPERFANALKVGHPVEAVSVARPGQVFSGSIEAIDNRIDQASRTLRVRARIANEDDMLRAGMSFTVTMQFTGDTYPAVDPLAVQWDSDGSYVWRIDEMKAEKVRVSVVQRNPDRVLVSGALKEDEPVVIEGLQRLREGGEVRFAPGGNNGAEGGGPRLAVTQ